MIEAELSDIPPSIRLQYQQRFPALSDKLQIFDARIYFSENSDVARAAGSSEDLIRHFCEFGHRECRLYAEGVTYAALFSEAFPALAGRLQDFDPDEYRRANRDIGGPGSTARDFFEHYCRSGANELRVGRDDGRIPDRREAIRRLAGKSVDCDIRVYAHVFFPDAGAALIPYLKNLAALGARTALSFSDMTFSPLEMERFAKSVSAEEGPGAAVMTAPPEGRDWGGFHRLWQEFRPADESIVFFLHSKKSQHMAPVVGELWRNELLGPICGSYGAILRAVELLQSGYSLVGSALHRSRNVGPNRQLVQEFLPLLSLDIDIDAAEFVGGTMFAIQGRVLNKFFQALSSHIDFVRRGANATLFDGSMAHACERLIGYYAAANGKGISWVV